MHGAHQALRQLRRGAPLFLTAVPLLKAGEADRHTGRYATRNVDTEKGRNEVEKLGVHRANAHHKTRWIWLIKEPLVVFLCLTHTTLDRRYF